MIVVAAALLLFVLSLNNACAAGPYDGRWEGTATSPDKHCRGAAIALTVDAPIVLGTAKFEGDTSAINGSVDARGSVGATIGFQFLTGQFNGEQFEGTFKFANCDWEATLRHTGADGSHAAVSNGLQRRF